MRIVKIRRPGPRRKTLASSIIAQILLDVRCLCSGYQNYKPKTITGIKIYHELKEHDKTYLFNVSNFPKNLWEQMKQILNIQSNVPAYLTYKEDVLEREQASYLSKYLPVYPENPELHFERQLQVIIDEIVNEFKNQNGGDMNENGNGNGIQWE